MDERSDPAIRVRYVHSRGETLAAALAEQDQIRVDHVTDPDDVCDTLATVECVVIVQGGGVDCFAVLDTIGAADIDRPVIVVAEPAVAERALSAGATDVVAADPAALPVAVLAHRIQRVVAAAERSEQPDVLTRTVLNALSDVVYVLDTDGRFRLWNEELLAVSGYEEATIDGMQLQELLAPSDRHRVDEAIECVSVDGGAETRDADIVTSTGNHCPYEFTVTPLTDGDGAVVGLTGTACEVTGRKLTEQRLTVLTRVLRHNVRNQMTVVRGRAERLEADIGPDPDIDAINRAATELSNLSDKARRVGAALRESANSQRPLDVADIIRTAIHALNREFPDAELELVAPDSLQARTTEAITFAVEELVRNGIVHNDNDTPCVRVTIEREHRGGDDESDTVAITVSDNGQGIPANELVALEAGEETDLQHPSGLGLWLVNWAVTAAAGDLVCTDCDGLGGASVTLRFPAAR